MPRESWCVVPDAHEPIVSREEFQEAQAIMHDSTYHKTDEEVLDSLRRLLANRGRLTQELINKARDVPSTQTFWKRFGSLRKAYALIGYTGCQSSMAFTLTRRKMADIRRSLLQQITVMFPSQVSVLQENGRHKARLLLNDGSRVTVYLCRPHYRGDGVILWNFDTGRSDGFKALLCRLNPDNSTFFDFYLVTSVANATRLVLKADDPRLLGAIRFTDIRQLLWAIDTLGATSKTRKALHQRSGHR